MAACETILKAFDGPNTTCPAKTNCTFCPPGWTPGWNLPTQSNGTANATHCYKFVGVSSGAPPSAYDSLCAQFNATAVSIESAQENALVLNVSATAQPSIGTIYIPLRLNRPGNPPGQYAGIASLVWTDNTVIAAGGFGFTTGAQNNAGVFPWSSTGFVPQPDNAPAPATCVNMWVAPGQTCGNLCSNPPNGGSNSLQVGQWADITCDFAFQGTVCEYVPPQP